MAPRTKKGCWTCRIRKKKCDEAHPSCGPCAFRQIICYGYGEKPWFMHREEDQKAEIEKIQRAVNESLRARRAFRVAKKQGRVVQQRPIVPAFDGQHGSESNASEPYQTRPFVKTEPTHAAQDQGSIPYLLPLSDPWQPTFDHPQQEPTNNTIKKDRTPTNAVTALAFRGPQQPVENAVSYPFTFHPDAPPAENANDLEMIMNYLDNIFPLQYYFYQPSAAERGRGWLLSMLLRSKPLYYTALAFTSVQRISASQDDAVTENRLLEELDHQHSLVMAGLVQQLEELPRLQGQEHLKLGLEILACTIQLQSIEIFRNKKWWKGWKGDWEVHTNAAGALLSVIGSGLDLSSSSADSATSDDSPEPGNTFSTDSISSFLSEIAGLDFFMSSYVWSDIMRCANLGVKTSMQDSFFYLNYLEEERIRLDRLMGCRNWAMIALREISALEAWRNEMLAGLKSPILTGHSIGIDNLIVPLLTEKSTEIESRLKRGLSSTSTNIDGSTKYERETELVTNIFGLSAMIYLSIVVSGAFGRLPAAQGDVLRTLSAMQSLPKHLLMRVSWPYCVAGCLAEGGSRENFRQLLSETNAEGHPMGQLWNALDLMENFWKIRESLISQQHTESPWALAMKIMEMKTLLI
jgi:C6 transcription factor Pro1